MNKSPDLVLSIDLKCKVFRYEPILPWTVAQGDEFKRIKSALSLLDYKASYGS